MDFDATKKKQRKDTLATNSKANTIMVGEDRISKLPDEILTRILSFLPTKDAVGTSVLSKRWSDLWTFMTDLDFDDRLLYSHEKATGTEKQHFVNFVNRVLQRLSSSCITGVTLCLSASDKDEYHPCHHIDAWISAFLRMRVQKLLIRYNQTVFVDFCALFQSNSLVELELKLLSNVSIVPSNSYLANLQILNISRMTVVGDNIQSKEMVLNFPVLKVFTAIHCTWLHVNEVILNTPLLQSFSITSSFLKNAQGPTSSAPQNTAIKITAPHLKKFLYNGQLLEEIILSDPLSILHAFLEIQHCGMRDDWHQTVVKACLLLKELHSIETLQLGNSLVMELCHPNVQLSALPMFGRLVFLKLDLGYESYAQRVLLDLLPKSPNLQRLVFFCVCPKFDRELLTSEVPSCLVSSLKVMEINLGSWGEENVFLVKYILEKAQALEQLTINLCMLKEVDVKNVNRELLSYRKASENISIKVQRITGKRSRKIMLVAL